jgi:uncharacterized membrane protein
MNKAGSSTAAAAVIGAITGLRSTAGLNVIAHGGGNGARARGPLSPVAELAALGEMIADKAIDLPARTEPAPFAVRIALGAVTAGVLSRRAGASAGLAAVVGSLTAAATTFAATRLRRSITRRSRTPDAVVGFWEDGLVLLGSAWLLARSRDAARD